MTTRTEPPPPGLEALLGALRAVGLQVGAREVLRLHHVFALSPALRPDSEHPPDRQLRDLLAAALAHDPAERRRLDQVYEPWAERWEQWARRAGSGGEVPEPADEPRAWRPFRGPEEPAEERKKRWPRVRWRPLAVIAASVTLIGLVIATWIWMIDRSVRLEAPVIPRAAQPPPLEAPDTGEETFRILPPEETPTTFTEWVPSLTVVSEPSPTGRAWPPIALGALALLAAGGLVWRWSRKPWIPDPLPEPLPGPARLPLLPLDAGPELLDPEGERTLVWGVGRHVADELTNELDLEATVRDTARGGGLPALRYAPEKRLREVWLWLDGTAGDSAMERWAEEVAGSLARAGLPVRIGGFDGYPEELVWDEGQVFRPQEVEAHRQTALVAVCTDGEVLGRHLEDARGVRVRALLRALAAWPRLALVDFSRGAALAAEVGPLGLSCVAPRDLPAFFGLGSVPAGTSDEVDPGELRAWRAALALGVRPVDRPTANALRRELGLALSPWAFHLLAGNGADDDPTLPRRAGGSLAWEPEGRVTLVAWLAEASLDEPTGLRQGSLMERALDFWQARLAEEAEKRHERGPLDPWEDHPAERHLRMEIALLHLWREPAAGAEDLYKLRSDELSTLIGERLGELAPRDCTHPDDGRIPLPWRLGDLTDRTLYLLAELDLGGVGRGALRRPGRLGWAVGLMASLGLGLIGLGYSGLVRQAIEAPPQILQEGVAPPLQARAFSKTIEQSKGRWKVVAGTPQGKVVAEEVASGSTLRLQWKDQPDTPCRELLAGGETMRCGSGRHHATTRDIYSDWPLRSVARIDITANPKSARQFATTLIDTGTIDVAVLMEVEMIRMPESIGEWDLETGQLLEFVTPRGMLWWDSFAPEFATPGEVTIADFAELESRLAALDGVALASEIWRFAGDLNEPASRALVSNCPWQVGEHVPTSMLFQHICGGTFRIGSNKDDPQAFTDEQPAHEVTVGGFWIGQTEVTNEEYRVFRPEHSGNDDEPAVGVSWFDARAYCRSLEESEGWEYDLPTEAEWEYAARAGTSTPWSFGDDEARLGQYAWFGEDPSGKAHPVAEKEANPWGLYDVHGNVWEWVLDCWDEVAYKQRARDTPIRDPGLEPGSCHQSDTPGVSRVVRGGSFGNGPRGLRSAIRRWDVPVVRDGVLGFRCVRRPVR